MAKRRTQPAPHDDKPFPCPSGCGGVLGAANELGQLVDTDKEGASLWICVGGAAAACGFSVDADRDDGTGEERCPSDGAPLRFMPELVGDTCGGLTLRGWNQCDHCGGVWLTRKGVPWSGGRADGRWRLAAGGRSLDAGQHRLRVDHKNKVRKAQGDERDEIVTLMARISRMPAFEAALEKIANGELDADAMRKLAAEALSIGDGADEIDA